MTDTDSHKIASVRRAEAIGWHILLARADASEADRKEFTRWLEADPANRLAYERAGSPPPAEDAQDEESKLVSFRRIAARPTWIAAAALVAVSLIVFFMVRTEPAAPVSYATRDQIKSVMLADGTHIELNKATNILVEFTGDERRITLAEGEAFFDVAKDARPFSVRAGDRVVRDSGTKFDVLRTKSTVAVTVVEGRVSVVPRAGQTGAVSLVPGDRLLYSETADTARVEHVDPAEALAWHIRRPMGG